MPTVADCIPAPVGALGTPAIFPFHKGLVTAVTASTGLAQTHTVQGLNHLYGGWEFEASRHFCAAIKEDPRCLMAHWGLVMSLLTPSPEIDSARIATATRMLQLIEDGAGTDKERGFAYGLVKYIEEGPAGAAAAYKKVAEKFPNDLQAEMLLSLFSRGGYDQFGTITPDQENAENRLLKSIDHNPSTVVPLHALLLIRAEAPDLRPSLESARLLCQQAPDYPPYFHLLGHYEWRSGNHREAASAFNRAGTLYSLWMKQNNITPADADGWVRAECYRVVALASKGDFDNALASAEKIAGTTLDPERATSAGTRQLLWDARTLPARVLMRRNAPGDTVKAIASLPDAEENLPFRDKSLSYWWSDGLKIALEARRLLEIGSREKASQTIEAMTFHGQAMSKKQKTASIIGERSEWNRSFRALEILAAQLRGRFALTGPAEGRGSAFNWYRAATDRQKPATMLETPPLLTPMATTLGDYYITAAQPAKATEAYEEALKSFPNDAITLEKLEIAKDAAKEK